MRVLLAFILALLSSVAIAGYDLHVTRKAHWADEVGPKISFSEWESYLKTDKQIRRDSQNSKYDFIVSLPGGDFPLWYDKSMGELSTKNPSPEAIKKLVGISRVLKAKVQGDDGEIYPLKP